MLALRNLSTGPDYKKYHESVSTSRQCGGGLRFSESCQLLEYYYVNNDARKLTNTLLIMDCVGLHFSSSCQLLEYYYGNDARTHTNTLWIMDCVGLRFFKLSAVV